MRRLGWVISVLILVGCGGDDASPDPLPDFVPGPEVDTSQPAPADDAPAADPAPAETTIPTAPPPAVKGPACKKHLTVIFTVGVPGTSKMTPNGCWTPVITDGSAVKTYRKCTTSNFQAGNATAANYAYDDTNPNHPLAQEKTFLAACANGATGDGYEFMAYRGGWRPLAASHLRATFAELYGSAPTDIASLFHVTGVYKGNPISTRKDVFPMMNFGPPAASHLETKVKTEALALCKTVADGGYLGMYNASYQEGMTATDPRLLAIESALDTCTTK